MKNKDVIRWVIDCMLAHDPSITEELALVVERESRAEWGGQEVRVWKTPTGKVGRPPRKSYDESKVFADGLTSKATDDIVDSHGISRRTLYRLMKRGVR